MTKDKLIKYSQCAQCKNLSKYTAMAICDLIDDIESTYVNTSLEQWKAFKHIRNAIRDKFVFRKVQGII